MTIEIRRCANCANLNKSPTADQPLCWNLIGIEPSDVAAGSVCDQHLSQKEDARETEMVAAFQRLGCGWAVPDFLRAGALARRAVETARHHQKNCDE